MSGGRAHASRGAWLLALSFACDHAPVVQSPAKVPAPEPEPTVQSAIVVAPPADPTPFHRGEDLAVKVLPAKWKRSPVPLAGSSAGIFAPDDSGYFVDARTPTFTGGALVSAAHPDGVKVSVPVHEAGFASDGRRMYLLDDDANEVSVVTVADGSILGKWPGAFVARFLGNDTLLVWNKCQLMRVDLTHPSAAPSPVGPRLCGGADASEDGRTWLVASPSSYPVMVGTRPYTRVEKLDAKTGDVVGVASGSQDEPLSDIRLAPGGERVCFRGQGVQCLDLRGSTIAALPKPSGDPFSLRWDPAGEQFLTTAAGDLIWVDVRARTVRTIALHEDVREWGFLPDGKRIFAYDKGAWIVELATGNAIEVYPKEVQVAVLTASPKSDRFLVTHAAGAGTQVDLVEVEP